MKNIILCVLVFSLSCKNLNTSEQEDHKFHHPLSLVKSQKFEKAAVASAHHLASQVGLQILLEGGNAIDAAIAVQFALAVTYPVAGNIGGGGFMVIKTSAGKYDALDFREKAPLNSHRDMYLDEDKNVIPNLSLLGHLANGVPGTVDGMYKAFEKYSKLKNWKSLVMPSVELAEIGFYVSEDHAASLNSCRNEFLKVNDDSTAFVRDSLWKEGDILIQTDLGRTLRSIAKNGRSGFYEGEVADQIVNEMKSSNGIISHEDLKAYSSKWREPILSEYRNHKIISMPPSSSGGIALTQLLGSVEPYDLSKMGFHSVEAIHLMTEAERRVFADRATHLGDIDFYDVPKDVLISDEYNIKRMSDFSASMATKTSDVEAGIIKESEQTTHYSIIDEEGNAVSVTTTLNTAFGSKVVIGGAGFLMNNEMDDFSSKPGVPNFFGLVGNDANAIEPGKRMLSSMTPTIVEKDGKTKIIVGSPGGSTIITSVFQTIVNIIDFGMNANDATQACRFHHQWLPDKIQIENECLDSNVVGQLQQMGHVVDTRGSIGRVETILIHEDGSIEAAADARGDDSVAGY